MIIGRKTAMSDAIFVTLGDENRIFTVNISIGKPYDSKIPEPSKVHPTLT